jgi:hypothetical protein
MRIVLSLFCLLAGIACLAVFFSYREETKEEKQTKTVTWTMGLASSPWLVAISEDQTIEEHKAGGTIERKMQRLNRRDPVFLSASWLFLLGALVFGSVFLRSLRASTK